MKLHLFCVTWLVLCALPLIQANAGHGDEDTPYDPEEESEYTEEDADFFGDLSRDDWVDLNDMENAYEVDHSAPKASISQKIKNAGKNIKDKVKDFGKNIKDKVLRCDYSQYERNITLLRKELNECKLERKSIMGRLRLMEGEGKKNNKDPPLVLPYMKRYVLFLQDKFTEKAYGTDVSDYKMVVSINEESRSSLEKFAASESGEGIQDVITALEGMVINVELMEEPYTDARLQWIKEQLTLTNLLHFVSVIAFCRVALAMSVSMSFSWVSLLIRSLLAMFLFSIPWNWYHLYLKAKAAKLAEIEKDVPEECRSNSEQSMWQALTAAFNFRKDTCAEYYEKITIDPLWEVPPTRAIAVTFTKFVMEPLELLGQGISRFITQALQDLPIHLQPMVFLVCVAILLLLVIMVFGYNVRLFHFFRIENPQHIGGEQRVGFLQQIQQLEHRETQASQREQHLTQQLEAIQAEKTQLSEENIQLREENERQRKQVETIMAKLHRKPSPAIAPAETPAEREQTRAIAPAETQAIAHAATPAGGEPDAEDAVVPPVQPSAEFPVGPDARPSSTTRDVEEIVPSLCPISERLPPHPDRPCPPAARPALILERTPKQLPTTKEDQVDSTKRSPPVATVGPQLRPPSNSNNSDKSADPQQESTDETPLKAAGPREVASTEITVPTTTVTQASRPAVETIGTQFRRPVEVPDRLEDEEEDLYSASTEVAVVTSTEVETVTEIGRPLTAVAGRLDLTNQTQTTAPIITHTQSDTDLAAGDLGTELSVSSGASASCIPSHLSEEIPGSLMVPQRCRLFQEPSEEYIGEEQPTNQRNTGPDSVLQASRLQGIGASREGSYLSESTSAGGSLSLEAGSVAAMQSDLDVPLQSVVTKSGAPSTIDLHHNFSANPAKTSPSIAAVTSTSTDALSTSWVGVSSEGLEEVGQGDAESHLVEDSDDGIDVIEESVEDDGLS